MGRYDEYEPQRYDCIAVKDDYIESILPLCSRIDTFANTTKNPFKGLNEDGITLIPPDSAAKIAEILDKIGNPSFGKLIVMLKKAAEERKYVIHYGI